MKSGTALPTSRDVNEKPYSLASSGMDDAMRRETLDSKAKILRQGHVKRHGRAMSTADLMRLGVLAAQNFQVDLGCGKSVRVCTDGVKHSVVAQQLPL